MIIGWADITGRGKLTSQLCFMAGLFAQYSEKQHLLISRRPVKADYYLGLAPEDADKKRADLLRLAVNGQLTTQLLKDYSLPLMKGLDYLDASFVDSKEGEYKQVLYEYLLEKAGEGYGYVFADLSREIEMSRSVDKLVLCLPQSPAAIREALRGQSLSFERGRLPLLLFGQYFSDSRWTKKRLAKEIAAADVLSLSFSYELFDALNEGSLLDYVKRKYGNWETEYRQFAKFVGGGEERRK